MSTNNEPGAIADLIRLGAETATGKTQTAAFDIHGIKTRLTTNSGAVAAAMHGFFRAFPGSLEDEPDIEVHLFTVERLEDAMSPVPADAETLYDWRTVKFYHAGPMRYQAVNNRARVAADIERRLEVGFAEEALLQSDWLITNVFFYPLWGQLLKECGLYPLHAAGLVKDGRASLFLGRSGSGKSTLSLHLVQQGYGILSDDTVFLRESGGIIEALAFPEDINVSEQTIELFPELSRVEKFTVNELRQKSSFSIEELYPECIAASGIPAIMVFPEIAESETTVAEPISQTAALALSMRYGYFFLDPSTTGRHFEILSMLARQVKCFRLHAGSDQEQLKQVVTGLLESALTEEKSSGERNE